MSIRKYAIKDIASGLFYNIHSGKFSTKPKLYDRSNEAHKTARYIFGRLASADSIAARFWPGVKAEDVKVITIELVEKSVEDVWTMFGELTHPETGEKAPAGKFWAKNIQGGWFLESIGASYTSSPASETYHCS